MQQVCSIRFFRMNTTLCCGLVLLGLSFQALAQSQPGLLAQPYPYLIIEQDLRQVLRELGRNLGVGVDVSRGVSGVVRGVRRGDSADGFLRRLAQAHDLVWYLDRDTLYVSTRDENATEVMPAVGLNGQQRRHLMEQWSRQSVGIAIDVDNRPSSLVVTGPLSFRQRIAALVGRAPVAATRVAASGGTAGITVYRGRNGSRQTVTPP